MRHISRIIVVLTFICVQQQWRSGEGAPYPDRFSSFEDGPSFKQEGWDNVAVRTKEFRSIANSIVADSFDLQVNQFLNTTRSLDEFLELFNNRSLNLPGITQYFPALLLADVQQDVARFLKNLRYTAMRNATNFHRITNVVVDAMNKSSNPYPKHLSQPRISKVANNAFRFSKRLFEGVLEGASAVFRSVPYERNKF